MNNFVRGLWAVSFLLAIAGVVHAQDLGQTLTAELVHKQVYPRGFSADAAVHWRWDTSAQHWVMDAPTYRTLGMILVDAVKVKSDRIVIKGQRYTLLKHEGKLAASVPWQRVVITIDTMGSPADATEPATLLTQLFFATTGEIVAALPKDYKTTLPAEDRALKRGKDDLAVAVAQKEKACDCAKPDAVGCDREHPTMAMQGMTPPRVKAMVDAEFSEEARSHKFSGNVTVSLTVDESGRAKDLWLIRPAGVGLDAKSMEAAAQYTFFPATCHGAPVPVVLSVEVNFNIH